MLGAVTGLAPHLLHHAGILASTALLADLTGTVLFAVLGLAMMIPMVLRLRRRFGTWWAPGIAVLMFAVMFAGSTRVIGPALRGGTGNGTPEPGPSHSVPPGEHSQHHD